MREQAPAQPVARKPKQDKKSASKKKKEERELLLAFYVFKFFWQVINVLFYISMPFLMY